MKLADVFDWPAWLGLALGLALGCHPQVVTPEPGAAPVPASVATDARATRVVGRVTRAGAPLPGVVAMIGDERLGVAISDDAGEFELAVPDGFREAPAIGLRLRDPDGHKGWAVLRNRPGPVTATFAFDETAGVTVTLEPGEMTDEDRAWLEVRAWTDREAEAWAARAEDDVEGHLAHWRRVADAIAAELDPLRRRLMVAGQFAIGRADLERGLTRTDAANAALTELGLDDPSWASEPSSLPTAVWESGRWEPLRGALDQAITDYPQPEVAALIALERYVSSASDHPEETDGVWQRWVSRPALAHTAVGPIMASRSPTRVIAPGKPAPELCVEDLDGGRLCLADLRGEVVVLEVWATWCEGCRKSIAPLRAAYELLSAQTKPPVFLSIDPYESPETIREFLAALPGGPPVWRQGWVVEAEREAFDAAFDMSGVPVFVLIGADGRIMASSPALRAENLVEQTGWLGSAL